MANDSRGPLSIRHTIDSPRFQNFIIGLIVLNTLQMMCEYYLMPEWLGDLLERCNLVLTLAFTGSEAHSREGGVLIRKLKPGPGSS